MVYISLKEMAWKKAVSQSRFTAFFNLIKELK